MPHLTIRSIAPSELASWAALDDRPDRFLFRQVSGLVERAASRPDWLFVAERDGAPVGRLGIAADGLATSDPTLEYRLLGLWLPWDDRPLEVGRALVDAAVDAAIPPDGRHPLDFRVNPEHQEHADLRRTLAEATGFTLFQEKEGFRWSAEPPEPERRPARLLFRSLDEVGRDLFAHTMGRSTRGTFDRVDRHYASIVGEDGWGREMLELLEPEDAPSWRLAFAPDGEAAGYVLLSGFDEPGRATITHIGVVPEQRGNGYVDELLGEYNRLARERSFTSSISDVDVENLPMRAAMERNGHRSDATAWHVHHYRRIVGRA